MIIDILEIESTNNVIHQCTYKCEYTAGLNRRNISRQEHYDRNSIVTRTKLQSKFNQRDSKPD